MSGTKPGFSFKTKLFLLVLVSFGALMSIIILGIQARANQLAEEEIERSLSESQRIIHRRLESRFQAITETAGNFARDGRIRPAVYASETRTLQDMSEEFAKSLPFDSLMFVNAEGEILSRSDDAEAIGYSVARSPLFQAPLGGEPNQGIMASGSNLLQIVALPIFDNTARDLVRGVVSLAYEISPELVEEIHALTDADILFYTFQLDDDGVVEAPVRFLSTFAGQDVDALMQEESRWRAVLAGQRAEDQFDIGEDQYHGAYIPLKGSSGDVLGFALAMRSHSEIVRPFKAIERQVLITGLACLIAASIIAFLIALRMTRPLIELVGVTGAIEDGQYPDSKVVSRRDEIGVLYNAVYRMGRKLKEKEELESYLVKMSEEARILADDGNIDPEAATVVEGEVNPEWVETRPRLEDANLTTTSEAFLAQEDASVLRPGSRLGDRYTIRHVVGAGAMGVVYLADDRTLNEAVALKTLNTDMVSENAIDLMKQEIRLSRKISHPNVLRNHDFGQVDDHYFITMEFVAGQTLDRLVERRGPMDVRMGVILARQMCSAVAAAQQEGIVHRDLKPQNMMITHRGVLKVMDFGIAFSEFEGNQGVGVFGTPAFMAPEQFLGQGVDGRCDIYALGVILYYIFTGHNPYENKNLQVIVSMHTDEPVPDPSEVKPDLPDDIVQMILKATQKGKDDRYANANEMLLAVNRIQVS